jgi:hypothetical protein
VELMNVTKAMMEMQSVKERELKSAYFRVSFE